MITIDINTRPYFFPSDALQLHCDDDHWVFNAPANVTTFNATCTEEGTFEIEPQGGRCVQSCSTGPPEPPQDMEYDYNETATYNSEANIL